MRDLCEYVHMLRGRLRIKVPEVRRSPRRAAAVETELRSLSGVNSVKANPTTGNVLVLYDPTYLTQEAIFDVLRQLGCFQFAPVPRRQADGFPRFLVKSVAEVALERALLALF